MNKLILQAQDFFSAVPNEKIVFAADLKEALAPYRNQKCVVFSGTHYADAVKKEGFSVWCGIEAEPETSTVEKMAEFLRKENPEKLGV